MTSQDTRTWTYADRAVHVRRIAERESLRAEAAKRDAEKLRRSAAIYRRDRKAAIATLYAEAAELAEELVEIHADMAANALQLADALEKLDKDEAAA